MTFGQRWMTYMDSDVWLSDSDVWLMDSDVWLSDSDVWLSDSDVWLSDSDVWLSDSDVWLSDKIINSSRTKIFLFLKFHIYKYPFRFFYTGIQEF